MQSPGANSSAACLVPRRAPVTPRVRTAEAGAALPLEYHVRGLLGAGACGIVKITGPAGSGKSLAVEHLAHLFRDEARLWFYDEQFTTSPRDAPSRSLGIVTSKHAFESAIVSFEMVAWTDDDLIEYLVATHRGRVGSVMKRVAVSPDRAQLRGLPEPWRIILDVLAADDSIPDIWAALRWYLAFLLPDVTSRQEGQLFSLSALAQGDNAGLPVVYLDPFEPRVRRLIRHHCVKLPLAADLLFEQIQSGECAHLARRLPPELLCQIATLAGPSVCAAEFLSNLARRGPGQSNAASILNAMDIGWRPQPGYITNLAGAFLDGAKWSQVSLAGCIATGVHFACADLSKSRLGFGCFAKADFTGASLSGASMTSIRADEADFVGADLSSVLASRANFRGCHFERANLQSADLSGADLSCADLRDAKLTGCNLLGADLQNVQIAGADFSGADLSAAKLPRQDMSLANFDGASFRAANLVRCNLEYVNLPHANFRDAILLNALLTGSILPRVSFRGADLRKTGLADVEWEGADLRKADLTGASFHAGSTRSGLVGSVVPSEGSRTGFYTDDFNDRDFKSPEEIRKANLCGADLRGAKIDGVDFYLVDLRGALYSRSQAKWFGKCGAIL